MRSLVEKEGINDIRTLAKRLGISYQAAWKHYKDAYDETPAEARAEENLDKVKAAVEKLQPPAKPTVMYLSSQTKLNAEIVRIILGKHPEIEVAKENEEQKLERNMMIGYLMGEGIKDKGDLAALLGVAPETIHISSGGMHLETKLEIRNRENLEKVREAIGKLQSGTALTVPLLIDKTHLSEAVVSRLLEKHPEIEVVDGRKSRRPGLTRELTEYLAGREIRDEDDFVMLLERPAKKIRGYLRDSHIETKEEIRARENLEKVREAIGKLQPGTALTVPLLIDKTHLSKWIVWGLLEKHPEIEVVDGRSLRWGSRISEKKLRPIKRKPIEKITPDQTPTPATIEKMTGSWDLLKDYKETTVPAEFLKGVLKFSERVTGDGQQKAFAMLIDVLKKMNDKRIPLFSGEDKKDLSGRAETLIKERFETGSEELMGAHAAVLLRRGMQQFMDRSGKWNVNFHPPEVGDFLRAAYTKFYKDGYS